MKQSSLREMKKEATAHALAVAAFELTLERGFDGFVVDDVVQRAGYSRRTFANHYSCKEEAVAMAVIPFHGEEVFNHMFDMLPDNTTPLDVMYQFTKAQLTEEMLQKLHRLVILSKQHPTLEPYTLAVIHRMQSEAQQYLSELFHERYPTGYTHLLAGSVCSAILPLLDGSLHVLLPGQSIDEAPGATPFDQYLDTIFEYLKNGFQVT